MTRIKELDWQLFEAIQQKKATVHRRFPLFHGKICSSCRDLIIREWVWRTWGSGGFTGYIYICSKCAPTWDKAYDVSKDCCDPNKPKPITYSSSGY